MKKRSHTERVKSELERLRNEVGALEVTMKRLKSHSSETLAVGWTPLHLDPHNSSLSWTSDPLKTSS